MSIELWAVGYDAADAEKIALFWSQVLERPVTEGATQDLAAIQVTDDGPVLTFHKVPEGKTVKNRMHPDLISTDLDTDTERLLGLGATRLNDVTRGAARWTTFADPEGNEFDLIAR
jgi:catechol-2,3-dioxygenase